jgi:DNA-binding HxlR family transcriptional regulator
MFIREKNLRSMVLRQLQDQDKSISRLSRDLEKEGARLHRLVLTGYLQALSESGLLREKDIPPSRVYSLSGGRLQDIYGSLGERLRAAERRNDRRSRMAVFLLQRLFRRPVFLEELKRCGLPPPKRHRSVGAEERAEARRQVENAGMALPAQDPCYRVEEDFSAELYDLLSDELLERANLRPLRLETKQVKLI